MLVEIILIAIFFAAFIVEVVLTETEKFGWATALLIVCGAACGYFNIFGAALWVKAHVPQTLAFAGIYIVAGVAWSFMKWFSYLISYRDKWREAKEIDAVNKAKWTAKTKENLTKLWNDYGKASASFNEIKTKDLYADLRRPAPPHDLLPQNDEEWEAYYEDNYNDYHKKANNFSKPQASDNKAKITAWMAFWPFSFLGTFINDPIRRLFNFLFSSFKKLYQQMSDHLFKDLEPKEEK